MNFARPVIMSSLAALIAGWATVPVLEMPGPNAPTAYMALGTEPFWVLEITPAQLNFRGVDLPRVAIPNPGMRSANGVRTIRASRIIVNLRAEECSDGMSDDVYPDAAVVTVDGRRFTGCGGTALEPEAAALERSGWRITAVNGQPAVPDIEATFNFADGRVSGTAGCNRLMGTFTQARDQLTIGSMGATEMACAGPRGDQEQTVLAILRQPLTMRFGERMTMTWTAPDGSSIVLRRADWD